MTVERDHFVDGPRRITRVQLGVARDLEGMEAGQHLVGRATRVNFLDVHGRTG
jgi:hypothetical protein